MGILNRRSAGVSIPLFSIRSRGSWGIGELGDIGAFASWMQRAQLSMLALLPLHECAMGQESPYSALSAFALDPIYLSLGEMEDFQALGGEAGLQAEERDALERLRGKERIAHGEIRALKRRVLQRCFHHFLISGAATSAERGRSWEAFREEQAHWLPDYALFRSIKDADPQGWWPLWPEPIRDRDPLALQGAAVQHQESMAFFEYLQWQAHLQLGAAREEAARKSVSLFGDLPFTVAEDSADVWAHQREFSLDATVGSPPDPYAAEGQDWGLPAYRWGWVRETGYAWLRARARQAASHFDAIRVDHVVGLYRTYLLPKSGAPHFFDPSTEDAQREQGEAILHAMGDEGIGLVVEDLGTVPPFVRASLEAMRLPGYKVLRWEKDGPVFRDPTAWTARSVATTGTHDTEPLATWWEAMPPDERGAFCNIPSLSSLPDGAEAFTPQVHDAIFELLYKSGSNLLLPVIQDIVGSKDRINVPGTVGPDNWSYRLPWDVEQLLAGEGEIRHATDRVARLATAHGRLPR